LHKGSLELVHIFGSNITVSGGLEFDEFSLVFADKGRVTGVRVVVFEHITLVHQVLEGTLHDTTLAGLVSVGVRAVHKLLFRELHQDTGLKEAETFG